MTRAKRIEEAARALLHRLSKTSDTFDPEEDALEDALALPEEESARGVVVMLEGFTVVGLRRGQFPLGTAVRITVEGKESEP